MNLPLLKIRLTIFCLLLITVSSYAQYATNGWVVEDNHEYESVLVGNGAPAFEEEESSLQGVKMFFHENGQVAEVLTFQDNLEEGEAKFYYPNGQLAMAGAYKDGQMIGLWKFYTVDGQIASGDWEWKFAGSDHNVRVKGQLAFGKPYGKWSYETTSNKESFEVTFD